MNKDNKFSINSNSLQKRKLHIFGGDIYALKCCEIAISYKLEVIVRTGKRFEGPFRTFKNDLVRIYVGNNLDELMNNSPRPQEGDIGISISAPWIIGQDIIDMFQGHLIPDH